MTDPRKDSGKILDERRNHHLGYVPSNLGEDISYSEPLDEIGGRLAEGYAEGRFLSEGRLYNPE